MSLTPGTTLQDQKYVIQQQLHQSDFGVIYQAQHRYLEQSVVLHTLPDRVQQQSDFPQLRQQFLRQMRSIAQNPPQGTRLLDCFEEAGLPFAVFEIASELPHRDWLSLAPTDPSVGADLSAETDTPTALTKADLESSSRPIYAALNSQHSFVEETLPPVAAVPVAVSPPSSSATYAQIDETALVMSDATQPDMLPARNRSQAWLPLGLIFASVVGGLTGVGLGLSLRLAVAQSSASGATNSTDAIKAAPRLFSREQVFPGKADWPISETPQYYPADPLPIEEPVYRVDSPVEDYPLPTLQTLPSEVQVSTPEPSTSSIVKTNPSQSIESPVAPVEPEPASIPSSDSESIPSQSAIVPEPPAPPPPLAAPEDPIPGLPPLETSPAVPALPTGKTSVIKQ